MDGKSVGVGGFRGDRARGPPPGRLLVEVEVLGGALLEPQAIVVGRVLKELGRLLEHVLAVI
jgi:hypothetical protein